MPIEYVWLLDKPEPIEHCPSCGGTPFVSFLRGCVMRSPWSWAGLVSWLTRQPFRYCATICSECKQIVGHERPTEADL